MYKSMKKIFPTLTYAPFQLQNHHQHSATNTFADANGSLFIFNFTKPALFG